MRDSLEDFKQDFSIYAVVAFIFACVYIAGTLFIWFYPFKTIDIAVRDQISGMFLVMNTYGFVVMLSFGGYGYFFSRATGKKGIYLALVAVIVPFIFLASAYTYWPEGIFGV